jgi:alkanesulfonate monooxygenase SsuD/methylene tetrahydromethanopterin reductase-like flavin-dependent oxidoreductase (luciferase family)
MALAIIGGQPERFAPFADLHRRAALEAGHEPSPPLSINSHAYVADSSQRAADEFFPSYTAMMNAIGRERGWAPIGRPEFDALRAPRGALLVGSPQEVIEKILFQHEIFGHQRFLGRSPSARFRTIVRCMRSSSSARSWRLPSAKKLGAEQTRRCRRVSRPATIQEISCLR